MDFSAPSLEPKITKDFLLSKNSEETYMSTYLGVHMTNSLFRSPLRSDKRPTCHFYRNSKGDLIFHDFGTGFHANFIEVVMHINKCTYHKALQIIAEDFHFIEKVTVRPEVKIRKTDDKIYEKQETVIQINPKEYTDSELKWWSKYGISRDTLKKFKVFSCEDVFLNGLYFKSSTSRTYLFGYYCGKKQGRELWRIYSPQTPDFKFVSNTSSNIMQGIRQLPDTGNVVVISKAMKDVMSLYELGIPAIAPCSEKLFLSKQQLKALKKRFKHIIVFYDNDIPGLEGMRKIRKQYGKELSYMWIPRKFGVKDFSDFVEKYGKEETQKYVNEILKKYE